MTTQMQRLAMEVRKLDFVAADNCYELSSGRFVSGQFFYSPDTALGALGYGYMWFKEISFSDVICITKRNMENAVWNLTKHLDTVSEAISNAKKHLCHPARLQKVDDKLDLQKDLLKTVQDKCGFGS